MPKSDPSNESRGKSGILGGGRRFLSAITAAVSSSSHAIAGTLRSPRPAHTSSSTSIMTSMTAPVSSTMLADASLDRLDLATGDATVKRRSTLAAGGAKLKRHSSYETLRQLESAVALSRPTSTASNDSISRARSSTMTAAAAVHMEGVLGKRADAFHFDPRGSSGQSWKMYHAVIRGPKMLLFKTPPGVRLTDPLTSFTIPMQQRVVSREDRSSTVRLSLTTAARRSSTLRRRVDGSDADVDHARSITDSLGYVGETIHAEDFDRETRQFLFTPDLTGFQVGLGGYRFGFHCVEIAQTTLVRTKGILMLLFMDRIVLCKRRLSLKKAEERLARWKLDGVLDLRTVEMLESQTTMATEGDVTDMYGIQVFGRDFSGNPLNRLFSATSNKARTFWTRIVLETRDAVRHGWELSTGELFLSNDRHPQLSFSGDSTMPKGTLPALIHHLLFQSQYQLSLDTIDATSFYDIFLDVFPLFAPKMFVLDMLRRYMRAVVHGVPVIGMENGRVYVSRVIGAFILRWLERYPIDMDAKVKAALSAFLDEFELDLGESSGPIKEHLTRLEAPTSTAPNLTSKQGHVTIDSIATLGPEFVAKQIRNYHGVYPFSTTPNSSRYFLDKLSFSDVTLYPFVFSAEHPHFLTLTILDHIFDVSVRVQSSTYRASLISFWINVGEACRKLGDASAWMAIAFALFSPPVVRLHESWRFVDMDLQNTIRLRWFDALNFQSGLVELGAEYCCIAPQHETRPIPFIFGGWKAFETHLKSGHDDIINAEGLISVATCRKLFDVAVGILSKCDTRIEDRQSAEPVDPSMQGLFAELTHSAQQRTLDWNNYFHRSTRLEKFVSPEYHLACMKPFARYSTWRLPLRFVRLLADHQRLFLSYVAPHLSDNSAIRRKSTPEKLISRSRSGRASLALMLEENAFNGEAREDASGKRRRSMSRERISSAWTTAFHRATGSTDAMARSARQAPGSTENMSLTVDTKDVFFSGTLKTVAEEHHHVALYLTLTAASIDKLVECATIGVITFHGRLRDENGYGLPGFIANAELVFDSYAFSRQFLSSYRAFLSSFNLVERLEMIFLSADEQAEHLVTSPKATPMSIRRAVVEFFDTWSRLYPVDFQTSSSTACRAMAALRLFQEKSIAASVKSDISLRELLQAVLSRMCRLPYSLEASRIHRSIDTMSPDHAIFSLSLDQVGVNELIQHVENFVASRYSIRPEDAIRMIAVIETHCESSMSWFPREASRIQTTEEEVVIKDMYAVIEDCAYFGGREKAYIEEELPTSVRQLIRLHHGLMYWSIRQICQHGIDVRLRAARINKLLKAVASDRTSSSAENSSCGHFSMASAAFCSALVSPESRLFTRAWNEVAASLGGSLESLDSLIDLVGPEGDTSFSASMPDIGWILESIVEICQREPNVVVESGAVINYEKRAHLASLSAYACRFTTNDLLQSTIDEMPLFSKLSAADKRRIKDAAFKENTFGKSQSGKHSKNVRVFSRLVSEQIEKNRRIAKEYEKATLAETKAIQTTNVRERPKTLVDVAKTRRLSMAVTGSKDEGQRTTSRRRSRLDSIQGTLDANRFSKPVSVVSLVGASTKTTNAQEAVFEVATEDGVLTEFKAASSEAAIAWVQCLSDVIKTSSERRHTIILEDFAQTIRSKDEKTAEYPKEDVERRVFGVDLASLMPDEEIIPLAVEKMIYEIERRGLFEVGIYRVPGMQSRIDELIRLFNENEDVVDLSDEAWSDINVVGGALKQYFRDLPEPLLTFRLYHKFIAAVQLQDYNERLFALKDLIAELPRCNYVLLRRLIEHLERVTDYEEANRMYATNLAIVFGPTLCRPPPGPDNFALSVRHLGQYQNIIKNFILQYHWLFDIEDMVEDEEQRNLEGIAEEDES